MTQIGAPGHETIDIGTEAAPPFAVLPDPTKLFAHRARRFAELAPGSEIGGYLEFASRVCALQQRLADTAPEPVLPDAVALARAREAGMPPLQLASLAGDAAFAALRQHIATAMSEPPAGEPAWLEPAREAARLAASLDPAKVDAALDAIAANVVPPEQIAEHVLVAAAAQVHLTRMAARLDVGSLQPIADGVCPACGGPPLASAVVGRQLAHNARYCTCALCATEWNVVRVKCVKCSGTGGITYVSLDDGSAPPPPATEREKRRAKFDDDATPGEAIKGETCDTCRAYLKILYQVKNPNLEPLADDTASLALDIKLAEAGWQRIGRNPFLIGQGAAMPDDDAAASTEGADEGPRHG